MYKTELIEGITVNNAVDKIEKNNRNGKARISLCDYVIFRNSKGCACF